jgi:hypothetical protein
VDLDIAVTAAERTEAARHLIDQAQAEVVDLVVVSAIHLCVLGGPRHPLFDESVSRAWMKLGNRQRKKFTEAATESMVERGLLIDNGPRTDFRQHSGTYSLQPELGIMLAARCRPAFIIVTETTVRNMRTPRFFALGDQAQPVRGVVMEFPAVLPRESADDSPPLRQLGPLGRLYRYVLMSPDEAAAMLAKLVISPPRVSDGAVPAGYVVSAFRHYDEKNPPAYRLSVQGDGTKARLDDPGTGDGDQAGAEYDVEGLRAVMPWTGRCWLTACPRPRPG